MPEHNIFWGETHDNTYQTDPPPARIEESLRRAASHLDFYAAAYYTSCADAFQAGGHLSETDGKVALALEGWKPPERIEREWAEVKEATRAADAPGRFVAFPGYEWQGDGSSGDHNVFALREEDLDVHRVDTLAELYGRLRGKEALAIPHHFAYRAGVRGRDWRLFDPELTPFCEIFSVHGCSETDEEWIGLRHNSHMGPGVGGNTWQDALDRGLRLGCVCSTDNWGEMPGHYGRGLMACMAEELTCESLWRAFKARRVYGVTGDRIALDFTVDGEPMGGVVHAQGKRRVRAGGRAKSGAGFQTAARRVRVRVEGCDALDRVEILRNGRVIHTHCHQGTWRLPPAGRPARFKMRVECGWGPRPNELTVPPHPWSGELEVEGGKILSSQPCWITPGQGAPILEGARAAFKMLTNTAYLTGPQNANVFLFEADPAARLAVHLNGLEEAGPLAHFASASREMWFLEECEGMLQALAGIAPGSPERMDIYHHVAYKAKLHRPVPEAGYTAEFEIEDDEPFEGEIHYRVRVEQRNGQRAWGSPVWVRQ